MMDNYLVKIKDKSFGNEELKKISETLENAELDEAILFFGEKAVYFKRCKDYTLVVTTNKRSVGAVRFYEKDLIRKLKIRLKFEKIEEIFEIAEEVDNMDIEEFVSEKLR